MHGSLSGELKSHPGKKLIDHLCGTAERAEALLRFHGMDDLEREVLQAAYTHDLGKAAPEFQKYLGGRGKGVKHSLPSSFFIFSLGGYRFEDLFSAEAVRVHHSGLDSWEALSSFWNSYKKSACNISNSIKGLVPLWEPSINPGDWKKLMGKIFEQSPEYSPFTDYWLRVRSILSILVAADRLDAIDEELDLKPLPDFCPYNFEPSRSTSSSSEFERKRERVRLWRADVERRCLERVENVKEPGLFTITLPTGAGKTNIGLRTAHTIAKNLGYPTIIYALPFISIIEQNAAFARQVFDPGCEGFSSVSEQVQEDHSLILAEPDREDEGRQALAEKEERRNRSIRLFRYWKSPVVITTMVQLWNALFSPRAMGSINFHRLRRAVVLMDEPQSIAVRHWPGLRKMLQFIHERWGTVFILMTATQPRILEGKELAPGGIAFPFSRHRFHFVSPEDEKERFTLDDLPHLLESYISDFSKKSGLLVFNTRRSALRAYRMLEKLLKGEDEASVYMLSTWLTPSHRRKVLAEIKGLESNKKRRYLIATQAVEAGVDLDFDWAFRDFGPLDSIIQVAGRVNRSALKDEGVVLIAELRENADSERTFARQVYDSITLERTERVLRKNPVFVDNLTELESEESSSGLRTASEIVQEYYLLLSESFQSSPIWGNIKLGKWDEFTSLFEDKGFDVPVYVDQNGMLDETVLTPLLELERNLKNRERIKALHTKLQQFSIGVNESCAKTLLDPIVGDSEAGVEFIGGVGCVIRRPEIGAGKLYDPVLGFCPPDEKAPLDDYY